MSFSFARWSGSSFSLIARPAEGNQRAEEGRQWRHRTGLLSARQQRCDEHNRMLVPCSAGGRLVRCSRERTQGGSSSAGIAEAPSLSGSGLSEASLARRRASPRGPCPGSSPRGSAWRSRTGASWPAADTEAGGHGSESAASARPWWHRWAESAARAGTGGRKSYSGGRSTRQHLLVELLAVQDDREEVGLACSHKHAHTQHITVTQRTTTPTEHALLQQVHTS